MKQLVSGRGGADGPWCNDEGGMINHSLGAHGESIVPGGNE